MGFIFNVGVKVFETHTVNIYRYKAIGANATSSVIQYTVYRSYRISRQGPMHLPVYRIILDVALAPIALYL